jgi:hypothetical protein
MKFLKTLLALYGAVMALMAVAGLCGIGEYRLFYGTSDALAAKVEQTCASRAH